jgi:hypothetical protein
MPQPSIASLVDDLLLDPNAMYPREYTETGISKHSRHCKALFARRDFQCARCLELLHGSAPRGSWQEEYSARKLDWFQRSFIWE